MSLILSGTDGLSDVDGSATTPAIRGTDANTGIFFPAADTIAFAEGGTESMRITSTGDVGIGTSSPSQKLTVSSNSNDVMSVISTGDTNADLYLKATGTTLGNVRLRASANDMVAIAGGAERMRIDSSGNVGIGTTTMTRNLNIGNSTNAVGIGFQNTGTSGKNWSIFSTNAGSSIGGGNLGFYNDTDTAYRMILDGTGNLQFNSGYGSAATAYGCRAWVNFNGTGTPAIRGSGNVSSITDNSQGDFTVNFTNAMPDALYATVAACSTGDSSVETVLNINSQTSGAPVSPTTTATRMVISKSGVGRKDPEFVCVSIFR